MRRRWWLISVILVTLLISFRVPSAWSFHMGPTGNEEALCSLPQVIVCDNFEDRNTGGGDWTKHTYKNNGWALSETTCQTVIDTHAHDGNKSLQHNYTQVAVGVNNATACRGPDGGGAGFMSSAWVGNAQRTIYARWYVTFSSNYVRSPIAEKHGLIQPAGAGDGRMHPFGTVGGATPVIGREGQFPILFQNVGAPIPYVNNTWYCVEFRVTANNPGSASNGYVQGWIDGVQRWEYPNIQLTTANDAAFDALELSGYWNCLNSLCSTAGNSHPTMQRWIDRVVVSTTRIGCSGTPPDGPPTVPSQLLIR